MAELLSYTGNAGLGLGSSPGIPVSPDKPNLDVINQTARDIMLLDNERNMKLFQQKISDRDTLTKMILDDKVSTGDILPQYQQHFDQAKKEVERSFFQWKGNFNDLSGYSKYKDAVQHLKDVAAHAQVNTKEINQLRGEQAKATLPRKKEDIGKWIDQQLNQDFFNPVVPYQQFHDFNMDDVLAGVNPIKTEITDPKNPLFKYDVTYVDYNDILRNKRNQYINDQDAADSIDSFVTKFQRYNPGQQKQALDAIDAQILKYNADRGFTPADPNYVSKIQRQLGANGQTLITEPQSTFAAKYALANQAQFVTKVPKFQKDIGEYGLKSRKLDIEAAKLGIDRTKANAYMRHMDALTWKINNELKSQGTNVEKQYTDFINAIKPIGIDIRKGGVTKTTEPAIFLNELPQGYQFINGVIADKKGKVVAGKLEPFISTDPGKQPYYIPKYVNPQTGEKIDLKKLPPDMQEGYDLTRKKRNISLDDYVKALLKKGAIELILRGQNGTANYTSMYQSAKTLNAAATTKGEENVINPPASEPQTPEE